MGQTASRSRTVAGLARAASRCALPATGQEIPCKKDSPSRAPARSRAGSRSPRPATETSCSGRARRPRPTVRGRSVAKLCEKLGEPDAAAAGLDRDRPGGPARRDVHRRGRRRGPDPQGAAARRARRRGRPGGDPGHHHLVAVDRGAGRRPAAGRSGSSGCTSSTRCRGWSWSSWCFPPRPATRSATAPGRSARRSARPRSRSPTRPGSSSTGCCSPTCSTPSS